MKLDALFHCYSPLCTSIMYCRLFIQLPKCRMAYTGYLHVHVYGKARGDSILYEQTVCLWSSLDSAVGKVHVPHCFVRDRRCKHAL